MKFHQVLTAAAGNAAQICRRQTNSRLRASNRRMLRQEGERIIQCCIIGKRMDKVRSGMNEVIYEQEKKEYRTLWYTTIDREKMRCCTINNDRDTAIREKA